MSRLTLVEKTKLNLRDVTVVISGGNATEVEMMIQVFTGFGTGRVLRAEDIQCLKDTIEYEDVDLVILDAALGLFACTEATQWIRRRDDETHVAPVMVICGSPMEALIMATRDAGANYVVAKPITPFVLFQRLVWIVKEHRSFIRSETYIGPDRRVRALGPPSGMAGRRHDDLSLEVGAATDPNLSQSEIDALMAPARRVKL